MQPKRIIVSLLVVILALLSAGTVVSAEDSPTLDIAVEVSSSTALSDNLCVVSDGEIVTVSVTIKNNPGISLAHFDVVYNPNYLKPAVNEDGTLKWTPSGLFGSAVTETVTIDHTRGKIGYTAYSADLNVANTGKVFTCSFIALKHGNTDLKIDMKKNDVTYIKPDGKWAEEGFGAVNVTYGSNPAATAVPVKVHTLNQNYTTTPASCTSGGMKVYSCTSCGETVSIGDGTPALGHTPVVVPSVPVSCVQDGLTEGKKCSVCSAVIVPQVVAVPKGDDHHTVVTDPAVAPTCSAVGRTEGSHCSTCEKVLVQPTEVETVEHTYGDWVEDKDAGTRTKTCKVCGATQSETLSQKSGCGSVVGGTAALSALALLLPVAVFARKREEND